MDKKTQHPMDDLMNVANKESITIRLDADVLKFFKDTGKGYQTRINRVLRQFVYESIKGS